MRASSILVIVVLANAAVGAVQPAVPYRLLSSRESGSPGTIKEFDYNVSVDSYLEVSDVKNVICRLISDEKPQRYEILSIGVYYKLDRYVHAGEGEPADSAEYREHRIVQYHWNKDSPKDSRRLVVIKDAKGKSLPEWRFHDFNHMKSCR